MSFSERHDAILLEILEDKRSIQGFLEAVFGFLSRKTDFYVEMKKPTDNIGLPAGIKEQIVLTTLRQFDPKHQAKISLQKASVESEVPPAIAEVEVADSDCCDDKKLQKTIEDTEMKNVEEIKNQKHQVLSTEFQPNEYYNGGKYDNYCWSQTITDIEIHIRLPEHIRSAKNLNVKITPDYIKVQEKITGTMIMEGKLHSKCKSNDAVWSLSGGKLQITLDKIIETWWNRLIITEPEIDLTKVDSSRPIDELPEETQAALEKIRWDQSQKMQGLPTSDEIEKAKILEKAWNLKGSPFQGQKFDPSSVEFY